MTLITIAIPVFNGERYLKSCLESAINQTYDDIEILVIDDGSTDNSLELVKSYEKIDTRIRVISNPKNLGLVGNWNKCLKEARGEWIKILFQDDLIRSDSVEIMHTEALRHQKRFVVCARDFIIEENASEAFKQFYSKKLYKLESRYTELTEMNSITFANIMKETGFFENFVGEPTTFLIHKSIVEKYGNFNKHLTQLCDYEFVVRVVSQEGIIFIPKFLASFRVHAQSESTRNAKFRVLKAGIIDKILMLHDLIYNPRYICIREICNKEHLLHRYQELYNILIYNVGFGKAREYLLEHYSAYKNLRLLKFSWKLAFEKFLNKIRSN